MACSFADILKTPCGDAVRRFTGKRIYLSECDKNTESHLQSWKIPGGVISEVSLILCRIGDFSGDAKQLTICPVHRFSLGIGWKRTSEKCQVPHEIAQHSVDRIPPKGDRGIGYLQSRKILESIRVLIPVGSAICRRCREGTMAEGTLAQISGEIEGATAEISDKFSHMTLDEPASTEESDTSNGCEKYTSVWEPNGNTTGSSDETDDLTTKQKTFLLQFLSSVGQEEVNILSTDWGEAKYSTKRKHMVQASKAIHAVLSVLAPNNASSLWRELQVSSMVNAYCDLGNFNIIELELIQTLVECYNSASSWDTRRQYLSIMAERVTYEQLQQLIPGISQYKLGIARKHAMKYGPGAEVKPTHTPRMRIDPSKLDHFVSFITSDITVKDMPFGERNIKLSTGEELIVPNMIRMMIPNRICKQYMQFCEETGFTPMGKRTMLSILEECKASVRTSLQGLDYFIVNGIEAFNMLHQVVERLVILGQSQTWGRQQTQLLKSYKQYIQSDYKVHVSDSSEVPDHCSTYALSDSRDMDFFGEECDHTHKQSCSRCQEYSDVIKNIEEGLSNATFSSASERDDLEYSIKEAKADIYALKSHQLRLINQQKAKANAMDHLDDRTVLVVQDWAMKFVPAKYRESQTEWFGKRGIPWHVSVVLRKKDGVLESETLLHVFNPTTQDSSAVIAIMNHTMKVLKEDMPAVENIFYMSDNAGCYHCTATIQAALDLSRKTGVKIKQLDFTEAQGGKGICDRKAAMVKNHIGIYVNEGHNVETAEHFKQAVESHGGVPGVKVFLCHLDSKLTPGHSIVNIKNYNNFKFTTDGILARRAYGIGTGKVLDKVNHSAPPPMSTSGTTQSRFEPVKPRRKPVTTQATQDDDSSTDEESCVDKQQNKLFSCPEEGCIKAYRYYIGLENHIMFGKHIKTPDKETLHDKVKVMYAEKIASYQSAYPFTSGSIGEHDEDTDLVRGWALPIKKTVTRFNAKQKAFLDRIFQDGQKSGSKADPDTVAKEMRYAKDTSGQRLFTITEFLSSRQIANYFSRMAMKIRGTAISETDELVDTQMPRAQQNHINIFEEAIDTVGLKHPIISHSYNLCSLVADNKLRDLNLPVLKMICHALETNIDSAEDRRKRNAYQKALENLVYSCSCQT